MAGDTRSRSPRRTRRRAAALLLAAALLAGCSPDVEYNDHGDQVPQPELSEARPTAWHEAEIVDETHIRVTFWGGVDDCFGHLVEVEETDSSITISLATGGLPRNREACILPAVEYTTLIETEQPIGDREIIDGNEE